ncbi:polyamine transporter tpo5 [Friedmanniomyces endolithicus]|uniref:Polyamine transporter tpo5 n=1 Tax=Friedmanniomyces endolithicus TaxID=329885 RepID=A0AAN6G1H4_9PEZI|nr:polyamine transporter tpo5 [Friedmanniomyces endolithicus]
MPPITPPAQDTLGHYTTLNTVMTSETSVWKVNIILPAKSRDDSQESSTMKLFGNGSERADDPDTKDEGTLAEQGYKQELRRDWSLIHNFGVSFSIISVITGITTLFEYGLTTGGPGVMSIGWIVVSFFTMFVSHIEECALEPTSARTTEDSISLAFGKCVHCWIERIGGMSSLFVKEVLIRGGLPAVDHEA